jgi:hypothetical protein
MDVPAGKKFQALYKLVQKIVFQTLVLPFTKKNIIKVGKDEPMEIDINYLVCFTFTSK